MNRNMILAILLAALIVLAWAVLTTGKAGAPANGDVGQDGRPANSSVLSQEKCPCGMCACSAECRGESCDCKACACKKCGCPR